MTTPLRVFVIDDSEIARELITLILGDHGFAVESSATPFDLGTALSGFRPALILLDLRMPGLSEARLPEVVQQYRAACDAFVVLHSAHDPEEVARIVQNAGADGSIEKTDDDTLFVERVNQWVSKSKIAH
jgi:two-component system KDP operon response regulator KdpE